MPRDDAETRKRRRKRIQQLREAGMNPRDIGQKLGLHHTTVRFYLSENLSEKTPTVSPTSAAQIIAAGPGEAALLMPTVMPGLGTWWKLGSHLLYCGDSTDEAFRQQLEGAAFAFADPPYNASAAEWDRGFLWAHDYLAEVASIVAVTPGISALPDFFAITRMPYRWSMASWIKNGMTRGAIGFGNWIYIALFSFADSLHRRSQDVIPVTIDTGTSSETNHKGRKPDQLMARLLAIFTGPGDLVVDPFLGSGTTLFAAETLDRRCIGAEIEPEFCAEIMGRFGRWERWEP